MKKYLLYWGVFIVVAAIIFAWWWTRPANVIERMTTLSVAAESTLFSKSEGSKRIYLLKVKSLYVKKVVDGCEFHGGALASADQTSAAGLNNDADFKALGLFTSNHIGCFIKGNTGKEAWEFFVKDNFLYFQRSLL